MTTTIDKLIAPSTREMDWKRAGSPVLTSDETDLGASDHTFADRGANASTAAANGATSAVSDCGRRVWA